jgi:DNA topoisomerase-1
MRTLIIVKSPAKARSLGRDYTVKASVGHIRDLRPMRWAWMWTMTFGQRASSSRGNSEACPEPLGFARDELRRRVAGLRKAANLANTVVLAVDPDRDGEAIAWHIQQVLRKKLPDTVLRAAFHEIPVLSHALSEVEGTESAIKQALADPGQLNVSLVRAQEARRVVDRLVGYELREESTSRFARWNVTWDPVEIGH